MSISNHKKGSLRDKEIVGLIGQQKCMNAEQLKLLVFPDVSSRMAYKVLARLADPRRKPRLLYRDRYSSIEPYFYYLKRPGQIDHVLGVSWIYTWVCLTLKSYEKLHSFEREVKSKTLRTDAFMCVKNLWANTLNFFFFEFHITESGNDFDKVSKYNNFYANEEYKGAWWAPLAKRFPAVVVITTGDKSPIVERIKAENTHDLEFRVYTLDEIKEECSYGRSSRKSIRAI